MSKNKTVGIIIKIVVLVLVVALLGAGIGLIYRYTNGFNEDFKTFYLEYNGKKILQSSDEMGFIKGTEAKIGVRYTFDFGEEARDYSVKVYPNEEEKFTYTVGERILQWRASAVTEDLSAVFGLKKENAGSTLSCKISKLERVQLDVKHTFYRTESSSMGYGYQNQIDTVYFSVPKRLFDEYGELQRIKAEWYEYKTKPILVTSNKEYYDWISKYIGVTADQITDDRYFVTEPFDSYPEDLVASWWFLLSNSIIPAIMWSIPKGHRTVDYAVNSWNVSEGWESTLQTDPLYYIFGTKDWCGIEEYDPYAENVEIGENIRIEENDTDDCAFMRPAPACADPSPITSGNCSRMVSSAIKTVCSI